MPPIQPSIQAPLRQQFFMHSLFADYGSGEFLTEDDISLPRLEKFAELIVRECMSHAEEIGRLNHGQGSWRAVYDRIRIKMLGEEL